MFIINGYDRKSNCLKSQDLLFLGALIKNQQGQHRLNLVSTNIFKEIFFVFVKVQRTHVLKLQNKEEILQTIRGGTELALYFLQ